MKYYFASAGIACLAAIAPLNAHAATFSQLFVFGDSLSDAGNLFQASGGLLPQTPPYAQRFSNGPVWVEYLADDLNLNPTLFTEFLAGGDPAEGVNFAFGGAGTGVANVVQPSLPPVGALAQVNLFLSSSPLLQPDDDALYIYLAGGNDFAGSSATPAQTNINVPLANTLLALQQLITAGAQNILVSNVPDISKTPRFATLSDAEEGVLSQLITDYNQALFDRIDLLALGAPEVTFTKFDFNGLFLDAIANPGNYYLTNVTESCLSDYQFPFDLFYNICGTPDSYLFWDDFHPTTVAHSIIANAAYIQLHEPEAVPEPGTRWSLVALGKVVVGGTLYRRRARLQVR